MSLQVWSVFTETSVEAGSNRTRLGLDWLRLETRLAVLGLFPAPFRGRQFRLRRPHSTPPRTLRRFAPRSGLADRQRLRVHRRPRYPRPPRPAAPPPRATAAQPPSPPHPPRRF